MIWGLTLLPGQSYSVIVEEEVQLSMVALESRGNCGAYVTKPVQITVHTGKAEFLLCTLVHGQLYQQIVDVKLLPKEEVVFCAHGEGFVHVTGYTKQFIQDGSFDDTYQEVDPGQVDPSLEFPEEEVWQPMMTEEQNNLENETSIVPVQRVTTVYPREPVGEEHHQPKKEDLPAQESTSTLSDQEQATAVSAATTSAESAIDVNDNEEAEFVQIVVPMTEPNMNPSKQPDEAEYSSRGTLFTDPTMPSLPSTSSSFSNPDRYQNRRRIPDLTPSAAFPPITAINSSCYACKRCREEFTSCKDLEHHETLPTHWERRHVCYVCQRGFVNKCVLIVHERTHNSIKPYKCAKCPKAFAQRGNLNVHKKMHSKYERLECTFCKCRFRFEADCQRHMRTCQKGRL